MLRISSCHVLLKPQLSRGLSSLVVSEEIREAVASCKPVVALESTIITHGLPYPHNLDMANRVEAEIRSMGAIPATTAFIGGKPKVGLSKSEVELLASSQAYKVSRRDIPYVMANSLHGGTTISGTMILSEKAGIRVFATGGLGGVHREGEKTMDVSADLDELGKTAVAVICAGPKSILDIGRTMEYLETKGVFVGTLGPPGTNIPGFYTRDSGVKSVYNFSTFQEAARIIFESDAMGLGNGQLFCIPPPENVALDPRLIDSIIEDASQEALRRDIKGKDLTPFLLSKIAEATKGRSVKSNIEFVLSNARAASEIAKCLSLLCSPRHMPSSPPLPPTRSVSSTTHGGIQAGHHENKVGGAVVIGCIALDTYCKMDDVVLHDSNPAQISSSIGGVGYNVACGAVKNGISSLTFLSAVGQDPYGMKISESIEIDHVFERITEFGTGQYISSHNSKGDLVVAAADMRIIENMSPEFVESQISNANPSVVQVDCNISSLLMSFVYRLSTTHGFRMIVEPTSLAKAKKIAFNQLDTDFPLFLITPTTAELKSIYEELLLKDKFDTDRWFPVMDKLGVDSMLRTQIEALSTRNPKFKCLLSDGILQMATSVLPFVDNIVVKDGANGVYVFSKDTAAFSSGQNKDASFSLRTAGGLLLEQYDPPEQLHDGPTNVTGAGDALAGVLLSSLAADASSFKKMELRSSIIMDAQRAAIDRIR